MLIVLVIRCECLEADVMKEEMAKKFLRLKSVTRSKKQKEFFKFRKKRTAQNTK